MVFHNNYELSMHHMTWPNDKNAYEYLAFSCETQMLRDVKVSREDLWNNLIRIVARIFFHKTGYSVFLLLQQILQRLDKICRVDRT